MRIARPSVRLPERTRLRASSAERSARPRSPFDSAASAAAVMRPASSSGSPARVDPRSDRRAPRRSRRRRAPAPPRGGSGRPPAPAGHRDRSAQPIAWDRFLPLAPANRRRADAQRPVAVHKRLVRRLPEEDMPERELGLWRTGSPAAARGTSRSTRLASRLPICVARSSPPSSAATPPPKHLAEDRRCPQSPPIRRGP